MKLILTVLFLTNLFQLAMAQQSSYKVVVRSYFDDMTVQKTQTTDQLYTAYVSDFI
jgi:hypothetical protein